MDHTAIIGVGMTRIEANKQSDTFADMAWESVNLALTDAGITIDEIDNVVTTSNDFWGRQNHFLHGGERLPAAPGIKMFPVWKAMAHSARFTA